MTQFFSYIISRFSSPKKISKIKNISFLLSYNSKPLTDINSLTKTPRPSYLNFKIFSTSSIFILAYCYIKKIWGTVGLISLILLERRSPLPYGIMLRMLLHYRFINFLSPLPSWQLTFGSLRRWCSHRWFLLTSKFTLLLLTGLVLIKANL